jgi:hypothetical protein
MLLAGPCKQGFLEHVLYHHLTNTKWMQMRLACRETK